MYSDTPYTHTIIRKATSSTTFSAKLPPINSRGILIIDNVAVSISAHKTKYVDVGFIKGSSVTIMETLIIDQNDEFFPTRHTVYVPSSYQMYIRFPSPTSGVIYTCHIFGRLRCHS